MIVVLTLKGSWEGLEDTFDSWDFRGAILVQEGSLNIGRFLEVIGLDILVNVVRKEAFVWVDASDSVGIDGGGNLKQIYGSSGILVGVRPGDLELLTKHLTSAFRPTWMNV